MMNCINAFISFVAARVTGRPCVTGYPRGARHGLRTAFLVLPLLLAACATPPQDDSEVLFPAEVKDPLEPVNRGLFTFNLALDKAVVRPIARGYETVIPEPVRTGVRNFLRNLNAPVVFANDLLQGEMARAGTTIGRLVVNSSVGIGGVLDPASRLGLPYHAEDLGQTLAVWGVGEGPYLMLPLLGPSSLRGVAGRVGDYFLDPLNYWTRNSGRRITDYAPWGRLALGIIDQRSRNYRQLEEMEERSLDFYAMARSSYRQGRAAAIANHDRAR